MLLTCLRAPNLCKDPGRALRGEMKVGNDLLLTFMQDHIIRYKHKHMLKKTCHGSPAMICEKVHVLPSSLDTAAMVSQRCVMCMTPAALACIDVGIGHGIRDGDEPYTHLSQEQLPAQRCCWQGCFVIGHDVDDSSNRQVYALCKEYNITCAAQDCQ